MFGTLVYTLLVPILAAQAQISPPNLVGTWTSQSRAVSTGPGFANPANMTFEYPKNTGVSYSFTDDNHYEIARYRFKGNGSEPNCITGIMQWVHGTYEQAANGSLVMTPFGDGYQQIQDPCAAQSNFIESYNFTEVISIVRQFRDATQGLKLHLFEFDGTPVAPLFLLSETPTMLPTRLLRNVTTGASPAIERRTNGALHVAGADVRTIGGIVGAAALTLLL
ncbi:Reversal of tor2 lethality [Pleurotus pulmonarius]|nr:Reversal of tor2 lethality [Pleurotus pulmonarius]KAF4580672.1 Reversal of tor2 lethality [Pleurotus pulmonarius]KAF4580783.1 Reversal of tor2 lethality [Pleurotus pulmonarius]